MAKKPKKAAKPKSKAKAAKPKASTKPKAKAKAKPAPKKSAGTPALPKDLETRLSALAKQMDKTVDAVVLQALCEFADAWEDHFRTVEAMVVEDERVQIVAKFE